jgi:hypothetical protein
MSERVEYVVRDAAGRDYWHIYANAEAARRCCNANNDENDPHDPVLSLRGPWAVIKRTITEEAVDV